jgi:hypothetical protein
VAPADDARAGPEAEAAIRRLTRVDQALHAAASGHRTRRPEPRSWWWQPQRRCPQGTGWEDVRWSDAIGWHRWTLGPETVARLDGPDAAAGGAPLAVRVDVEAAAAAERLAGLVVDLDGVEVACTREELPSGGQRLTARVAPGDRAPRTVRLRAPGSGPGQRGVAVGAISVTPEPAQAG